jgi:hypothetical protein
MKMIVDYGGKCDNCGKNNSEIHVEIKKNNDNDSLQENWCLECT